MKEEARDWTLPRQLSIPAYEHAHVDSRNDPYARRLNVTPPDGCDQLRYIAHASSQQQKHRRRNKRKRKTMKRKISAVANK
jgi:hypothetical protein